MDNLEQHVKRVHPKNKIDVESALDSKDRRSFVQTRTHLRKRPLTTGAKRIIVAGLIVVTVLAGAYAIAALSPKPSLYADHSYVNLGKVGQSKYSHTFVFSNRGSVPLTISRIWTSCGCTTAKLVQHGVESPEFGMPGHGGPTGPWEAKLQPGDNASLIVYYDATEMPDKFVGERYVFVDSNDPVNPEYQFTIRVDETP